MRRVFGLRSHVPLSRQASSVAGNATGEIPTKKESAAVKPSAAASVKQEGASSTTMKIEKQIKDVNTDAKDYHDVKNVKK